MILCPRGQRPMTKCRPRFLSVRQHLLSTVAMEYVLCSRKDWRHHYAVSLYCIEQNKAVLSLVISRTNQCTHVTHQTQDYLHVFFSVSGFNFPVWFCYQVSYKAKTKNLHGIYRTTIVCYFLFIVCEILRPLQWSASGICSSLTEGC